MLAIRLARTGKINRAQFQVVVQEHTIAPGGRHVEVLGSYDPHQKKSTFKAERVKYWLEKGAQPSNTIHNLLISQGIISGEKRKVKMPAKKVEEVKTEETNLEKKAETAASEAPLAGQSANEADSKAEETKNDEVKPVEESLAGQAKIEEVKKK